MIKLIRRWWSYTTAKLTGKFNEKADPAVQLEQAIREAQDQHRRLREQAANVIASQKQAELRLNKRMNDLERLNGNARQALVMADQAGRNGQGDKAAQYTAAAETIATQLIQVEKDVADLKALVLQATQASDQAKAAVTQNSKVLQQKIGERAKLLSQLDQAKMQEQMNKAMASLNEAVGDDVPTLNEVRDKIEARYTKAKAMAELSETQVDTSIQEIEEATTNAAAQDRLSELRSELGLTAGSATQLDSPAAGSTPESTADLESGSTADRASATTPEPPPA
jgi:phage shock protein A